MTAVPNHHILRLLRLYAEWTQSQLAEQLGVRATYVSDLETGKRPIGLSILRRYSQVFQVPLSSLIFFMEECDSGFRPAHGFLQRKALSFLEWMRGQTGLAQQDSPADTETYDSDDEESPHSAK